MVDCKTADELLLSGGVGNPCVYQQPSVDFEPLNGGFTGTSPSCHTCKELLLLDIVCMSIIIILGPLLVIL